MLIYSCLVTESGCRTTFRSPERLTINGGEESRFSFYYGGGERKDRRVVGKRRKER